MRLPILLLVSLAALPALALPQTFVAGRLLAAPYALLIVAAAWAALQRRGPLLAAVRRAPALAWCAAALLSANTVAVLWTSDPARAPIDLAAYVAIPAAALLLGFHFAGAGWAGVGFIIAWAALALGAVWYTITTTPSVTVYTAASGYALTGDRVFVSPFTGEGVPGTRLGSEAMVAGVCGILAFGQRNWLARLALLLPSVGLLAVAFRTGTRGALAATLVGLAAVFISGLRPRHILGLLGAAAAAALAAGAYIAWFGLPERLRLEYTAARGLTGREEIWQAKFYEMLDVPSGVGVEEAFAQGVSSHNQWLEQAHVFGWLSGITYFIFTAALLFWSVRLLAGGGLHRAAGGAVIAVLTHSLVDSHMSSGKPAYYLLWLLAGVALAATVAVPRRAEVKTSARRQPWRPPLPA